MTYAISWPLQPTLVLPFRSGAFGGASGSGRTAKKRKVPALKTGLFPQGAKLRSLKADFFGVCKAWIVRRFL
jgi:hypothetical protein